MISIYLLCMLKQGAGCIYVCVGVYDHKIILLQEIRRKMRQKEQGASSEHVQLNQRIRQFLQTFKVNPCYHNYAHSLEPCLNYHSKDDCRRNPYHEHVFLYYPSALCNCGRAQCEKVHNLFQEYYHPLKYKTSNCTIMNCHMGLLCSGIHNNQYHLLQKSQFFRFDLNTFKTELCPQNFPGTHELSSCRYYHGDGDRRRNPTKIIYSHVSCVKPNCNDAQCPKTHNKIEQLYHPSRYKTKYCQNFFKRKNCTYHEFCSFAHSDQQIEIQLLHVLTKNQQFLDYKYKTVWCPYTESHDRATCPYAHNFQDFRRNPKQFYYTPQTCTAWMKGKIQSIEEAGCPQRLQCPKSHGWLEKKFHPDLKKWELGQRNLENDSTDMIETASKQILRRRPCEFEDLGVGAPFFKCEQKQQRGRSSEPRDRKTKNKDNEQQVILSLFGMEELLWKPVKWETSSARGRTKSKKKVKRERSADIPYSTSLKALLLKMGLGDKINPHRYTQVKLVGMCEDQIAKLDYLTFAQRNKLALVLRQYINTHGLQYIQYSKSMVQFFKFKSCGAILDKMKGKKVNQRKLLDMSAQAIEDLSFLEEQEKESLPVLLDNFVDDRDFRQLNTLIKNETLESEKSVQPGASSS